METKVRARSAREVSGTSEAIGPDPAWLVDTTPW
jgi:hypothetical protein